MASPREDSRNLRTQRNAWMYRTECALPAVAGELDRLRCGQRCTIIDDCVMSTAWPLRSFNVKHHVYALFNLQDTFQSLTYGFHVDCHGLP